MYLCCLYKPTFFFMGIQRHRQYPRVTLKIYHGLSLYLYLSYVIMSYSDLTWIIGNLWRFWGTWGFKFKSIGFCKGPLSCFARSWNHVDVVGQNCDVCSRPSASTLKSQTFATNKKGLPSDHPMESCWIILEYQKSEFSSSQFSPTYSIHSTFPLELSIVST